MKDADATSGAEAGAGADNGDDWLGDYLPYLLYRVSALMNARLQRQLASAGLSLSQWRVLSVLRSCGKQSIGSIVEHTLMEQPTVSRIVAAMHEEGYVHRRSAPADSRVVEVSISEMGQAKFAMIAPAAIRHQHDALSGLASAEIDALRLILTKIEENIVSAQ